LILKQYYLGCLAHASYLIAGARGGEAAVVDPQRDVDQYLDDAASLGLRVQHVVLTHFHADFIAGHLELRDRAGAKIYLGARAQAEYPFTPLREGDEVDLGGAQLRILETPGHTPEGISILVFDMAEAPAKPHAVLTGDTLFIGDVGRPDLMASVGISEKDLAGMLYDSLRTRLLTLPDETLVYPAHGAGSMCGRNLGSENVSTIGEQRRINYALQPMPKDAFIRLVTADLPETPAYFSYDAALNKRERPTLDRSLDRSLTPLPLDDVTRQVNAGAQLLDVREPAEFAAAHLAGAINIGLSGKFATWCGTLLDRQHPIVLIAEPGRQPEAAMRLGRIGFDHVAGYLSGGMQALAGRNDLLAGTERIAPATLATMMSGDSRPAVLDVRTAREHEDRSIPGSVNIPLDQLQRRLDDVPRGGRLVVHCASGYRSSIACSLLARAGRKGVVDLVGGIAGWEPAAS